MVNSRWPSLVNTLVQACYKKLTSWAEQQCNVCSTYLRSWRGRQRFSQGKLFQQYPATIRKQSSVFRSGPIKVSHWEGITISISLSWQDCLLNTPGNGLDQSGDLCVHIRSFMREDALSLTDGLMLTDVGDISATVCRSRVRGCGEPRLCSLRSIHVQGLVPHWISHVCAHSRNSALDNNRQQAASKRLADTFTLC